MVKQSVVSNSSFLPICQLVSGHLRVLRDPIYIMARNQLVYKDHPRVASSNLAMIFRRIGSGLSLFLRSTAELMYLSY